MGNTNNKFEKFSKLTFQDFKRLALDNSLSCYEKIGFPREYREGKEINIFADILNKLTNMLRNEQIVLDIGCGCSELAFIIIDFCRKKSHKLILVDSKEMLDLLPDDNHIVKIAGYFPDECSSIFTTYSSKINVIIAYSILHYVFEEGNIYKFLDKSLSLLAHGGQMLIGDIPNLGKRKRFFSSPSGVEFHKKFMNTDEPPEVFFNKIEEGYIDDSVILSIIFRSRAFGFDSYIMPQPGDLPMANRREDILIVKP